MYLGQTWIYLWKLDITLNSYIYSFTYRQVYDTLKSSSDRRTVEPCFADNNDIGETCMTLSQLMYSFSVNLKNSVRYQRGAIGGKGNRSVQKKYDKISWHCLKYPILNILGGIPHSNPVNCLLASLFQFIHVLYGTVSYSILVKQPYGILRILPAYIHTVISTY
jgi:hypothetical protein